MLNRVAAIVFLSLQALSAQASVTLYTNQAAYLAAVGATRDYFDFAGSPGVAVSGGSFSTNVTFGNCTDNTLESSCNTQVLHVDDAITDLGGSSAPNGVASVAWRFNLNDVFAFAFNYTSGDIDAIALVDTALGMTLIDTTSAGGFIGLVSDIAFYGGIGVNAVFATGAGNDRYYIDDFRINGTDGTSVPEPAGWALTGLALLAAARVTRRAAAAKVSPAPAV